MKQPLAIAVILPFAALALQWVLWPWIEPFVWFLFLPTVLVAARLTGYRGGLIATALSAPIAWYFFIPPRLSWQMETPAHLGSVVLFVVVAYLICELQRRLEREHAETADALAEARAANDKLARLYEEHRRTDEQLRETRARFQATFEQAAVGIAHTAPDGRWLRVNHKLCEILGYSEDDLRARRFQDITHPDDAAADLDLLQDMLARRINTGRLEKRYIRKDGGIVWVNLTVALSWSADDKPDYFIAVVEDIDARKRAEDALRKFSRVIEQTASTVIITDPEGVIEYVNPRFSASSGFSAQEAIGRQPNLIKSGLTSAHIYQELWATIRRGAVWQGELLNRRKDGSLYWESVIISPIRDDKGRITHFAGIKDDITERKRNEDALREREAALREAQRLAGIGNWRWDVHRDTSTWSDELYRIFGHDPALPPADFTSVAHYFAPESWQRLSAAVHAATAEGVPYKLDVELVRSDGSRRWALARGEPVRDASGRIVALRGTMQDITERHQSEVELRALRAEMEQLLTLHVASQTAAAIAHELNQPLNAITTYTEAAKRLLRAGNPQPDRLLHALEGSARQAQRAGAVMRELLGFLHKGETVSEAVDLNKAVRRALAIVESNGRGGFQSVVELAPQLRPVWANRLQLEKVLVNLISNAVDAMRQAGVARQRITVGLGTAADEDMAHVTVSDVGPGLDEHTARRVFEPFFSTKPKGLGLGLAISRSLVEAHGGRLWVETTPGAGASFHFTLPFAP